MSYSPPRQPYRADGAIGTRYRDADDDDRGFGLFGNARATDDVAGTLGGSTLLWTEIGRDVDGTDRPGLGADAVTARGSANAAVDLEDRLGDRHVLYRGFARTTFVERTAMMRRSGAAAAPPFSRISTGRPRRAGSR